MAEASRAEEGCIDYGYAEDIFDTGLIHVKEIWTDQAALDQHSRRIISLHGERRGPISVSANAICAFMTLASRAGPSACMETRGSCEGRSPGAHVQFATALGSCLRRSTTWFNLN